MRTFPYLNDVLQSFVSDKWHSFENIQEHQDAVWGQFLSNPATGQTRLKDVADQLQMTVEELCSQILTPLQKLTLSDWQAVLPQLNIPIRHKYKHELELQPMPEMNTLHWMVINVYNLGLNGLRVFSKPADYFESHFDDGSVDMISSLFLAESYCLPHRQCHYCGRLDSDPRGKPFGKQGLKLCHQPSCPTHSSNLPDHDENCCCRQWNRLKDNLKQNLKTHYDSPEEIKRIFLEFCTRQFERNLSLHQVPRPKREKPKNWESV